MRATQLVAELTDLISAHGDLDIICDDGGYIYGVRLDVDCGDYAIITSDHDCLGG
jgi:hypothetical protein